jgi:hypothetical protein
VETEPLFDSRERALLRRAVHMCIVRNDVLGIDPKDRPALEALERKLTRHVEG